jgi:hypothetical protein
MQDVKNEAQVGEGRTQLQLGEIERDVVALRAQIVKEEGEVRASQSALRDTQRMLEKEKSLAADKTAVADKAQCLVRELETSCAQLKLRVSSLEQVQ